ncbi:MAG: hypothetical protein ABSC63_12970 [Candidatus Binataceae bacterium]|jgi:uncharacterized protein YlzI (FlbEa/FlbD family)
MEPGEKIMFFVRGLSSNGKEVFVNPDQALYVCAAGFMQHNKTALVLTHNKRLIVDQDPETVRRRFEDYLKDIVETDDDAHRRLETDDGARHRDTH